MKTGTRLLGFVCVLVVLSSLPSEGSTYHVDRLTDANPHGGGVGSGLSGDLRYTITNAQSGDTITFTVTGTINANSFLPGITHNITIQGPGATSLTVSGSGFSVVSGAMVALSGMRITNVAGDGGGIWNNGTLTVNACTINGGRARPGDGGGGILNYTSGTLTLNNCTVSNNSAPRDPNYGGGFGGGILSYGTLTLNNCTVSGNSADTQGGGIAAGNLTLNNSTISGNMNGDVVAGPVTTRNTIISSCVASPFTSLGHNLIRSLAAPRPIVPGPGDLFNVDPMLGPLQDNGGPTQTMAPAPASPAIDTGDNTNAPPFDQRGPGFPRISGGAIDIGAIEVQSPSLQPDLNWTGGGIVGPTSLTTSTAFTISRDYTISTSFVRSSFTIGYYRSTNPTFGADAVRLGTETISAATDRTVGSHPGTSPPLQISSPGTYYLFARLDDGNVIPDSTRNDNIARAPQQVGVFAGGLSVSDTSITLGDQSSGSVTFTVSLSAASNQTVTVRYATADGTATAGSDYAAGSGTLTFAPGETSKTITVQVLRDPTNQGDETFSINLSSAVNATIVHGQGICTIHASGGGGGG